MILVAHCAPDVRARAAGALAGALGAHVLTVGDAAEAVGWLRRVRPHAVLLCPYLSGGGSGPVLAAIRGGAELRDTPILALVRGPEPGAAAWARGVADPDDPEALVAATRPFLPRA